MNNLFSLKRWCVRASAWLLIWGIATAMLQGQTAYIPNRGDNTVSIIDIPTSAVTSTVLLGGGDPSAVEISEDGEDIYFGPYDQSNQILVFDPVTNTVTDSITMSGSGGIGLKLNPAGTILYASNEVNGTISVINTLTMLEEATISVPGTPAGMAISPDGSEMYVPIFQANEVRVIDLLTNTVVDTISVGFSPRWVTYRPDGSQVYISNGGSNSVTVINTATRQDEGAYLVQAFPGVSVFSLDGTTLYVANQVSNTISVIDVVNTQTTNHIAVGTAPTGLDMSPDGSLLLTSNISSYDVTVVDVATESVLTTIPVGNQPFAFGNFISIYPESLPPATALNFDGVDDRIQMTGLDLEGPTTIETWVRPSPKFDFSTIMANKQGGFATPGFIFSINGYQDSSRSLVFETNASTIISDPGVIEWNQWQHVAVSTDGVSEARLYVNGQEVPVSPNSGVNLSMSNFTNYIGDLSVSNLNPHFEGDMDEFRVWNVARTGAEIMAYKDCNIDPNFPGLIAYFDFDEGNVGAPNLAFDTLTNKTGNGNNGLLENFALFGATSNWVEGNAIDDCPALMAASSLSFDGVDDHVGLPDDLASSFTGGMMTGTAWCYLNATQNWATIIKNWGNSNQGAFHFGLESNNQTLGVEIQQANGQSFTVSSPQIFPTGQWVFVAFTADGDSIRLYQDGELKATADYDGTLFTEFPATFLGAKPNDAGDGVDPFNPGYWDGRLDEISLWDRALTPSELDQVANCQPAAGTPNLVAYYNLDQGFIDVNNATITTLIDNSSGAYNGVLTNFALNGTESNWAEGNTLEECAPTVNIEETLSTSSISLTPNPATDLLNVRMEVKQAAEARVAIFDLSGRMIQSRNEFLYQGSQQLEMDVRQLSGGLYFLVIEIGEERHSEKFVKQN